MAEQNEPLLIANDVYLKSGIHIGTKFKTKYMGKFIYKTRPDGLSVLNLQKIDERIRVAATFLAKYDPEDILMVSRRENGWKPLKMLGKLTGISVVAGRYPPGLMTNTALENFNEAKVVLVTDSWPDRNAIKDAVKIRVPVIALCDTNNTANNIDLVIPCNNKGKKSLGIIFYLLAREYMKIRGMIKKEDEMKYKLEDFMEED